MNPSPSDPDIPRASGAKNHDHAQAVAFESGQEDFRLLVESIRDYAILMLDPEGRILTWNAGSQRIEGYEANEILGKSFELFYPLEDIEAGRPAATLRRALEEGRAEDESWCVRKSGARYWASCVITPLRGKDGSLRGYGMVTRDLTERKHADERYRLLVDSVNDYAIFMLDPSGKILSWNAGAERIKGWRADEAIGNSFTMFYTPEDVATGHPARELTIAAASGRFEEEGWRVRKDGSRIWANVVISRLNNTDGHLLGFSKVTRDLTERRLGDLKLRESEERFRLLVEGVRDYGILMLDPKGHISSWNAGAERIKGWRADEIIGRHFSVFYPPEDVKAGKPEYELVIAEREGRFEDHGHRVRKDGSRFYANVIITALRDETGRLRGFSKVTQDITERRRADEALRAAQTELEKRVEERTRALTAVNAELDAFSYSVSHDLRSPLRAIDGFGNLLLKRLDAGLDQESRAYLRRIREASQRMSQLIDDLLSLSQLGRSAMQKVEVDMRASVLTVATELERAEPERRVELVVGELPPAHADPSLVRVVWQNLLGNAWKYTSKHTSARVEVGATKRGAITVYWVKDDGAGFDMSYVDKLFGAFQRLHGSHEFSGTGIGLATVRRVVRRHGGDVWGQGEVEKGATFYFTLQGSTIASIEPGVPTGVEGLVAAHSAALREPS